MTKQTRPDFRVISELTEELIVDMHAVSRQDILEFTAHEIVELLTLKGSDYSAGHTWMNFVLQALIANTSIDTVFLVDVSKKLARLIAILQKDETNFESSEDSWVDLLGYLLLFVAYKRWERGQQNEVHTDSTD